jgi:tripartite-type tricarboxylate transporter receptor subunit TctC
MPNVMAVHPSVPAITVAEFIADAKANLSKINMASPGSYWSRAGNLRHGVQR